MQEKRRASALERFWPLLLALSIFLADQASKSLAVFWLSKGNSINLIDNFFRLTLVKNKGAAFGILPGFRGVVLLASLVAVLVVIFILHRSDSLSFLTSLALSFTLGGAMGNLCDRLFRGAVIDFLEVPFWPVFNLADTFLVIGLFLLILSYWKEGKSASHSL